MTALRIRDYVLFVHLGVTPQERSGLQEVRVDLDLYFDQPVRACATDKITDTICYSDLCKSLRATVNQREFALVEHLNEVLKMTLQRQLPAGQKFRLSVHKLYPPVENLRGGVIFEQGEI
jgi:dihydroneopterin aldolase